MAVADGVREAVSAVPVGVRRVGDRSVAVVGRDAVDRLGEAGNGQRVTIDVRIVVQRVDDHGGVLTGRSGVISGDRGVVEAGDGDCDRSGRVGLPVADCIREAVGAVEVRAGRVGEGAVGGHVHHPLGRRC